MTKPIDKSKQTVSERTKKVLRVNRETLAHVLPALPDKTIPKEVHGNTYSMTKRQGQALPPSNDLFKRGTYVPGDGERMQSGRPGADDHLKIKSRGNSV